MTRVRDLPLDGRRAYSCRISTFFSVLRSPLFSSSARDSGSSSTSSGRAHVGAGQLADFPDLRVREGGLSRPPPAEEINLADAALPERGQRVVADVGRGELVGRPAEDPRHVHGHVADADHRDLFLREVEPLLPVVWVPVVPGHEVRRRVAAPKILPGIPMRRSVWAPVV